MISMREESIFYSSGRLQLEGLYAENNGNEGAVICHPHPQLGGSMQNNVVVAMITSFFINGFSTLRFNFRGVGRSSGSYDNGIGEQEDISGAVSWMRQKGKTNILLAAYSFGAWVGAKWLQNNEIEHPAVLVSPPINVMDFDFSALTGKVGLIICAEKDQFCSCEQMKDIARSINCRFELIPDADHFYFGNESEIVAVLQDLSCNRKRETDK
jgi:alpha/beta superfamily hydrolase